MPPKSSQKSGKGSQRKGEKSKGEKSKSFMDQQDSDSGRGQGRILMVMTQGRHQVQETLLMKKKKNY